MTTEARTISLEEINRCISSLEPKPQTLSDLPELKERLKKYKNSDAWLVIGYVPKANCLSAVVRPSWTTNYCIDQMFVSKKILKEYLLQLDGFKQEEVAKKINDCFQKEPTLIQIKLGSNEVKPR